MHLDPATTAVVAVDMQNAFCHPDGSLYAPGSEPAIAPRADLLERAREPETQVIYTRDVHPPEQFEESYYYDEFDQWGEHVLEDSWDAELVDDLEVREGDHVVEKHTYDAFYNTELEGWLNARGIRDLVICGTLANVCVLHTGGSAGLRDFRPIMVEDCIGCIEPDHREYALEHAEWLFGEVLESADLEFDAA